MAALFADTSGVGNLADPTQRFHSLTAHHYRLARIQTRVVVTTNYVVAELVALLTSPLRFTRPSIIAFIDDLKASPYIEVVHVESLVDCASFVLMTRRGITESLTSDNHFEQAGFVRLLK